MEPLEKLNLLLEVITDYSMLQPPENQLTFGDLTKIGFAYRKRCEDFYKIENEEMVRRVQIMLDQSNQFSEMAKKFGK